MKKFIVLALICISQITSAAPEDRAFMALHYLQTMTGVPLAQAGKPGCLGKR
jgi:hypothetical protein